MTIRFPFTIMIIKTTIVPREMKSNQENTDREKVALCWEIREFSVALLDKIKRPLESTKQLVFQKKTLTGKRKKR